jgi:hypothetical protein
VTKPNEGDDEEEGDDAEDAKPSPTTGGAPVSTPSSPVVHDEGAKAAPQMDSPRLSVAGAPVIRFTLSEDAVVRAEIVPVTAHGTAASGAPQRVVAHARKGANRVRVSRGHLRRGRYRIVLRATDKAGKHSKSRTVFVKVH